MQIQVLAILVPIILGCVSGAKEMGFPSRLAPLLAVVFGIGFVALYTGELTGVGALVGIMTGLSASGLYSGGKKVVKG